MNATATPELAPESDEAFLSTPFVQQLIKQMRAQDTHGSWEGKTDLQLLKPFIHTAEERRALPILGDPDPETLWHLEIFYNAIAVAMPKSPAALRSGSVAPNSSCVSRKTSGASLSGKPRIVVIMISG